jgi:hypothetical protein
LIFCVFVEIGVFMYQTELDLGSFETTVPCDPVYGVSCSHEIASLIFWNAKLFTNTDMARELSHEIKCIALRWNFA